MPKTIRAGFIKVGQVIVSRGGYVPPMMDYIPNDNDLTKFILIHIISREDFHI